MTISVIGRSCGTAGEGHDVGLFILDPRVDACTGTETGNPGPSAQPEVSLISVPPAGGVASTPPVLQIRVAVGSFIAVSCAGQTTNLTDPFQASLDSPDATDVSVQEVSVCELSLGLEPQTLGAPGEAELASVLV